MTDDAQNPLAEPREDLHHIPAGQTISHMDRTEPGDLVRLALPNPVRFIEPESLSAAEILRRGGVDEETAAEFFRLPGRVEVG